MNYEDYSAVDFLKDEFFIQWILRNDPSTNEFWQRWMMEHPQKVDEVNQARAILSTFSLQDQHRINEKDYDKMLDNILIHQQKQLRAQKNYRIDRNSGLKRWYLAASIILLLTFSGLFYFNLHVPTPVIPVVPVAELKIKDIPAGAKYTLRLSDGSIVKINSTSQLKYPESFSDTLRKVYLTGEAFFEVERDESRPFIIETSAATTEVLGTSFNVRTIKRDSVTEVSVVSGSVKVKNEAGNERVLSPYEQGIVKSNDEKIITEQFNVKQVVGWKDGILLFEAEHFAGVVAKLENWYGVGIKVRPGLKVSGVYSGEFRNEALEEVLDGISYSYGFKYKMQDKDVYVY